MSSIGAFEKAKKYIETHSKEQKPEINASYGLKPCITISRQTGAGADRISNELINFFHSYLKQNATEWTVFDQNLIKKVLEDHNLPITLEKIMEEGKFSFIKSVANELLSGNPTTWSLVHKTTETILQLAHIGNVIIVGKGGAVITAGLKNVFNVRLVAELEDRIKHTMEVYNYKKLEALDFIKRDDEARKNYLKTYFHKNIEDPLLYHLTINTHLISDKEAAEIIGKTILQRFPSEFNFK